MKKKSCHKSQILNRINALENLILVEQHAQICFIIKRDTIAHSVFDDIHIALEIRKALLVNFQEATVRRWCHTRRELQRTELLCFVGEQDDLVVVNEFELIVCVHIGFTDDSPQPRAKHSHLVCHIERAAHSFANIIHDEYVAVIVHLDLSAWFRHRDQVLGAHFL